MGVVRLNVWLEIKLRRNLPFYLFIFISGSSFVSLSLIIHKELNDEG